MPTYNENSTVDNCTQMGAASKVNYNKLPEVAYFRVQSRGAVGTLKDLHDRKVGAWAVLVSCKDGKGLRLVSDVGYEHGMKIRGEFKTREDAVAAGLKYREKFGKASAKDEGEGGEKKRKPTKAELEDEVATLKRMIEEMKKAA